MAEDDASIGGQAEISRVFARERRLCLEIKAELGIGIKTISCICQEAKFSIPAPKYGCPAKVSDTEGWYFASLITSGQAETATDIARMVSPGQSRSVQVKTNQFHDKLLLELCNILACGLELRSLGRGVQQTMKHGGGHVMIWDCMHAQGTGLMC